MNRHDSRVAAIQGLYSWDMNEDKEAADVSSFNWIENKKEDDDLTFARLMLGGTLENLEEIDSEIKSRLSPKWDFSRVNKVTLAILRVSAYSLLYQKDLESAIIINEAVEIAKSFGIDDQAAFINGLLDRISKEKR
ncbi:MAG: transcription antitermination factor NusB [Treponema sp.]|nr:transcription antitermination factor NusB [Treponema sp.]